MPDQAGKPQTLQSVRDQFPGTQRWSYFDVAARGLLPRPSREAVDRYLDSLMFDGGDKAQMFDCGIGANPICHSDRSRTGRNCDY